MRFSPRWLRVNLRAKLGMFLLALLLWFLVVTEKYYDYAISIPVVVTGIAPERTLVQSIPESADVKFHARGRELLRLIYVSRPLLNIDLAHSTRSRVIHLTPEMVVVPAGLNVSPLDVVSPDSVQLRFDDLVQVSVAVTPALDLSLEPGYTLVGSPIIEPAAVQVSGPEHFLRGVKSVSTETLSRRNLSLSFETTLPLRFPEGIALEPSQKEVRIGLRVERLAERSIEGIPITTRAAPRERRLIIEPNSVRIELGGPVSLLAEIKPENFTCWVDWTEADETNPGWLPVHVEAEPGVEVTKVIPAKVRAVLRRP